MLLYANIRSLRNKVASLEVYLQQNPEIDIILLNEVWIYPDEVEYYELDGFDSIFCCRPTRGGGTAIYCRKTLTHTVIQSEPNNFSSIIIEIKMNHKKLKIGTYYNPAKENIPELCTMLDANYASQKNLLTIADANADLTSDNGHVRMYTDIIESNGATILNHQEITRFQTNKSFDHIVTNDNFILEKSNHSYED